MKLDISDLIKGNKTYPSWSTNSTHNLEGYKKQDGILVYYKTKSNKLISRWFPKKIEITPKLCYILGIIKGEGSNSLGKSNYRRFTFTNSDFVLVSIVLEELEKHKLFSKQKIIKKSIHLLHYTKPKEEVINFWSKKLKIPKEKFKCFETKMKTSQFGVCHLYISDVLLRRVVDLIHDNLIKIP